MPKLDPHELRIRAEQDNPPFTYHGSKIIHVATQILSRNRRDEIETKYIYAIESEKLIVFNSSLKSNLFNVLGLRFRSPTAKGQQDLSSDFYEKFVTNPEKHSGWLHNYKYTMVKPIPEPRIIHKAEEIIKNTKDPNSNDTKKKKNK